MPKPTELMSSLPDLPLVALGGTPPDSFLLAGWRVEPALNRVVSGSEVVQLEPKIMAVLVCLAERAGEVVTREALMATVWGDVHVGEDVLTRSIAELRKVFGDDSRSPQVIDTIRKRGYRLIAPVDPSFAPAGASIVPEDSTGGAVPLRSHRQPAPGRWTWWPAAGEGRALRLLGALALLALGASLVVLFAVPGSPGSDRVSTTTFAERPKGGNPARLAPLTSLPGTERDPAVSPDGSRVAYAVLDGEHPASQLFVQLLGSDNRRPLTDGTSEDRYPVFSPDGTRLAFVRRQGQRCDIMVTTVLGGPERRLSSCDPGVTRQMGWSPDGRRLAISDRLVEAGVVGIVLLDVESGVRRQLTRPRPPYRGDLEPVFSPDGRRVAFTRVVGGTVSDLWTVVLASGEEHRLTYDNRDVVGQGWSMDGRDLIFSSSRGGTYALWRISADGGEPRWLTGSGTKIKHPSLARDAPIVVYEDWSLEINVWQIPLDDPTPELARAVVRSTQWDFAPDASPRGNRLVLVSTRTGESAAWAFDLGTGDAERLSPPGMEVLSVVRWGPDGERVAFVASVAGQPDLYVVTLGEATPRRLTDDATREVAPAWSRDGGSLLFGADRDGEWRVWRFDLASGDVAPAAEPGSYAAQEGADGSLYWMREDRAGLWRRWPSGETSLVVDDLEPQSWADWAITERGLVYLAFDPASGETVLRLSPDGGGAARTLVELGDVGRPGLSVSADGDTLFFSRVDRAESDLMVGENLG